jgi:hypothetical protein
MPKAAKIVLPKNWQRFPSAYAKTHDYWFFPKGLAASADAISPRLTVLKQFEAGKPWGEIQADYVAALKKVGISNAESEWDDGRAPLARMLVQVLGNIGLAWVNDKDRIEITDAGNQFLQSAQRDNVLSNQIDRYQFWNPGIRAKVHEVVKVHPIPLIAEVMRTLNPQFISAREYELFVARARSYEDVDHVVDKIEEFRTLSDEQQHEVCRLCNQYMIGGKKRTSIYNTINLNRTYAFNVLTLSRLLEKDGVGLKFRKGALRAYRKYLRRYEAENMFIEFKTKRDWIAYLGNPSAQPTMETALDYYVSQGDVAAAVAVKKQQASTKEEVKEFREMILSEKAIEDHLEHNLDYIGDKIDCNLQLEGRQYSTTVGPIDLLCKDKKTDTWVVIELKKGRSADKVYGQCSRYMGWVRKNLAQPGQSVHGVIVAKTIDDKLKAARDAHDTVVSLIEFSFKAHAKVV